jgi:phosphotransferase system enzyme I (PtsP)
MALGYDSLSMPVTGIGPVKAAILKLNAQKLYGRIEPHININTRLSSIRETVHDFCLEENIPI